ncbi:MULTISPECIES: hypothetical protein [Myxococcus]|uniref:hypothetical protein n=1 Tax=Myxococcus TaxID=32 RepID=UPI001FE4ACD2|nr:MULTISPECIES: hypothetical protein [Myxococcus]
MKKAANKKQAPARADDGPPRRGARESTLATLRSVQRKGQAVTGTLKERMPTRDEARARVAQARSWTERTVRAHPVGLGLGALAVGFLSASLLPSSHAERRAYTRAADKLRGLADELESSGQFEDAVSSLRRMAITSAAERLTEKEPDTSPKRTAKRGERKGG